MTLPVNFTIQSAAAQTAAPFTLGHAFKQGDVPAGQSVVCTGATTFQAVHQNAWPDGSLKFALLSGTATLAAGVPLSLSLTVGSPASATALSTADLKATGIVASTDCGAPGIATWATTDWDTPFQVVASGPVMSSWVYRKPVGTDAHLVAWLEVRLYATGAVEVLPWIENGYVRVADPTNKTDTYIFTLGGTQRFNSLLDLRHHQRTPLVSGTIVSHWLASNPGVIPLHDRTYLQETELVPTYSKSLLSTSNAVTRQITSFTPLQTGNFIYDSDNMASTGYQRPIGLIPEHDMVYLTAPLSVLPAIHSSVQWNAYCAGRYSIHYRDETTNRPIRFSQYPNLVIRSNQGFKDNGSSSEYTPLQVTTPGPRWDVSHSPSLGYMAYLITGRWYFMEQSQFTATVNFLGNGNHPVLRDGVKGLTRPCNGAWQTRSAAWSWRSLVQALTITPDFDTTLRNEFKVSVQHNIDHYYDRYVVQTNNPFGFVEPGEDAYSGGQSILASWQQDFITAAMGYSMGLGMPLDAGYSAKLTAFFNWKAKSVVGRLGSFASGGFPYVNAAPYVLRVSANPWPNYVNGTGPWAASWDEIWAMLPAALTTASSPNTWLGSVDGPLCVEGTGSGERSMWGNIMPAISYAVRYGVTGAKAGYDKILNAPNFAAMLDTPFGNDPVWSVKPAVIPTEAVMASGIGTTLRIDTASLIPGRLVIGNTGLGVLGVVIRADTATGPNGPGVLYNNWDSGDDNKQFRTRVVTPPSAGTFFMREDGSWSLIGAPDGTYTIEHIPSVDGVDLVSSGETETATILVGVASTTGTVNLLGFGIVSSEAFGTPTVVGRKLGTISLITFGIPSQEALGTPTFVGSTSGILIFSGYGIQSQEVFGVPTFVQVIVPANGVVILSGYGIPSQEALGTPTVIPLYPNSGLVPDSPIGRVRLRIGDYNDLPMLPDIVIYTALEDCNGSVNRASALCAQYILGMLTAKTHKRLAQLETWSGEQFTNYVKFLQMTVLNPHLAMVAPVPYSGNGVEDHPIQTFVKDWKDGYLPGSLVLSPTTEGRTMDYAFT